MTTQHTYQITEIVGTSPDGIDAAIRTGLERARKTIRHLDWFEVGTIRGALNDGEITHFQVDMRLGFRVEEPK